MSDEKQESDMSETESLRDRIAAALEQADPQCASLALADAVIAELKHRYVLVPKSETLAELWKATQDELEADDE